MANTVIQLKWSEVTSTPPSLNVAEPAYSNTSNKLFIGLGDNSVVAIGGKYYTDTVDAATSANTSSTIVKRGSDGGFNATYMYGSLYGNANTATTLATSRNITLTGDASGSASFNGSADATITVDLSDTGVVAGTYGGGNQIPTFTVDAEGRLTAAANVSISTAFNFAGNTGTGATSSGGTVTIVGENGGGITTSFVDGTDTFGIAVDNTVVRTTGGTISGDLAISGNLIVSGNQIVNDVETIRVEDSLIQLAANNAGDALDIGLFGSYVSSGTKYTAFFRDATDGNYKLMTGGTEQPSAGNTVNVSAFSRATLDTNITGGTVSGLSSAIAVADGGTGASSFTAGRMLVGNGAGPLQALANTGTAGTYGAQTHVPVITTDAYGRVSSVSNTAIGGLDTSALASGTLSIARGGTNNTSYTAGAMLQYNGSGIVSLANTGTAGTYGSSSTIPVITTDAYGRVSSVTDTAISSLNTSVLTAGTLGVNRGGTGAASFTVKGVIVSNQSSTTGAMSALASSTEGHVLQIDNSGVPTFGHLNGGSF
jgi:hypothetical protein